MTTGGSHEYISRETETILKNTTSLMLCCFCSIPALLPRLAGYSAVDGGQDGHFVLIFPGVHLHRRTVSHKSPGLRPGVILHDGTSWRNCFALRGGFGESDLLMIGISCVWSGILLGRSLMID